MTNAIRLLAFAIQLPKLKLLRLVGQSARRRRATLALLHSSPHLLRDIGALEEHFVRRRE
jgi:hypothetical protein